MYMHTYIVTSRQQLSHFAICHNLWCRSQQVVFDYILCIFTFVHYSDHFSGEALVWSPSSYIISPLRECHLLLHKLVSCSASLLYHHRLSPYVILCFFFWDKSVFCSDYSITARPMLYLHRLYPPLNLNSRRASHLHYLNSNVRPASSFRSHIMYMYCHEPDSVFSLLIRYTWIHERSPLDQFIL